MGCVALYVLNRWLLQPMLSGAVLNFFSGYFNDILAGCLILAFVNLLLTIAKLPALQYLLPCLIFIFICGLFWELVTPLYLARSVGDPWDIAAYLAGGLLWYLLRRFIKI